MTKILIVDEDTDVQRLLRVKLQGAGYEVTQASDGSEAVQTAIAEQPDVIICEWLLPDMAGDQLLAELQAESPASVAIVLSDQSADETLTAALAGGAADFVSKPFSPLNIIERIRVNLQQRQLRETADDGE